MFDADENGLDLINADQRRQAEQRLEAFLRQGLESPVSEWTQKDVSHIKNAVRERLAAKQSNA